MITSTSLASRALRIAQETQQRGMRLALRQAVQIEAGVDRLLAARDALLHAAAKGRQRRGRRRRGRFAGAGGDALLRRAGAAAGPAGAMLIAVSKCALACSGAIDLVTVVHSTRSLRK